MPEGPEIRLAADKVAKVLVDRVVTDAEFSMPALKRFARRLVGERVSAVETRGKAMLTRFDNGLTLYSHNQLYGRWYTMKRPKMPKTNRQLRVALHTKTHSALLYSASDIEVLDDQQLSRHPFLSRLGPDVLDSSLEPGVIVGRLQDDAFRNRSLGLLYLDQGFLAGIGNYLRSEILWAARVNPAARPGELDARQRQRLARATLRISRRSYSTRGFTTPSTLARTLAAEGWTRGERRFQVFGREGQSCHECGSTIVCTTMGSRNLFVCPTCQPGDRS